MQSPNQLSLLSASSSACMFQCRRLRAVPVLRGEEVKTKRAYINWWCRRRMRHRYQQCRYNLRRIRGAQCTTPTPDSRRLSHTPKVGYLQLISSYFVVWLTLQLFLVFSAFLIEMLFVCCHYRSIRVHVRADVIFTRETEDGNIMRVPAYFSTSPQDVDGAHDVDLSEITRDLNAQAENWNSRGSNFVMTRIIRFVLCITRFRPLHGSSFLETPKCLRGKHCIVNVKNDDDKCFMWAVLSAIHPPSSSSSSYQPNRVSNYDAYKDELKFGDLKFPITTKDVPKFEHLNPHVSVNILVFGNTNREFCIEYLSPHRNRTHHVNLFLIEQHGKHHYVWIKNISRLVAGRTSSTNKTYICNSCLHLFSSARCLQEHEP